MIAYRYIAFAPMLGIENKLLIYSADTGWSYSDFNGFGPSLQPWLWFKFYWAAWALLLAVLARLLWVRSKEIGLRSRLRLASGRFKGLSRWATVVSVCGVIAVGGFILYNSYMLSNYDLASEKIDKSVEYEKQFIRFEHLPQPTIARTKLHVDLFPKQNKATIRGTYHLVNNTALPIDSILLSSVSGVSTHGIVFDRQAKVVTSGDNATDEVYVFANALQPGESVRVNFRVDYAQKVFTTVESNRM